MARGRIARLGQVLGSLDDEGGRELLASMCEVYKDVRVPVAERDISEEVRALSESRLGVVHGAEIFVGSR